MLSEGKQEELIKRLNRIEGQVRGIKKMVEEPKYCPDILNQITAVRRALDSVSLSMIEEHMNTCVSSGIRKGQGETYIKELKDTIGRFIR